MSVVSKIAPAQTAMLQDCRYLHDLDIGSYCTELADHAGVAGGVDAFLAPAGQARNAPPHAHSERYDVPRLAECGLARLDRILLDGDPHMAGRILGAIDGFAAAMADLTRTLLHEPGWEGVQRLAIDCDLCPSRIGTLAIGRASVLLSAQGETAALRPLTHSPDQAGLIGAANLVPLWMRSGRDCVLAIDVTEAAIRVGLVRLSAGEGGEEKVAGLEVWRFDPDSVTRDKAIAYLCDMVAHSAQRARRDKLRVSPMIGVGCPGLVDDAALFQRGAQRLRRRWDGMRFRLIERIKAAVPVLDGVPSIVALHNDAVVRGLSEAAAMRDVRRWGVLSLGQGFGNASFENHGMG
jgi:hypothetical protein